MAQGNSILQLKHHVLNGRLVQAKMLLAASHLALEDVQDEDGNAPLHWCAQGLEIESAKREASDEEACVFLLQTGASRNRKNHLGETALMTATRVACSDSVRAETLIEVLLTKAMIDPCQADSMGETPLMEAAATGLTGLGRLLLEHRANPLATSTTGLRASQLAESSGHMEFVDLLKSPLAERAAREAATRESQRAPERDEEEEEAIREKRVERSAKRFDQTLFGQKMHAGLAHHKDAPGKPYPEYGTLHDID